MENYQNNLKREADPAEIMSVLKLKLLASNAQNRHTLRFNQLRNSIIHIPSTIQNGKQFKSCELYKKEEDAQSIKINGQTNIFLRIYASKTKILTLREIKKQEQTKKQGQIESQRLRNKGSKKIFVSIAKKSSISKDNEKFGSQSVVNEYILDCKKSKQRGKKLKLSIYKNIAKGRNH